MGKSDHSEQDGEGDEDKRGQREKKKAGRKKETEEKQEQKKKGMGEIRETISVTSWKATIGSKSFPPFPLIHFHQDEIAGVFFQRGAVAIPQRGNLHAQEAFVKGPCEEGIQQVLMDQCQAQDSSTKPEPEAGPHKPLSALTD